MVRYSVEMHPVHSGQELIGMVQEIERLGFDGLWIGDSHLLWREAYTLLGAFATATSSLTLGTGVTQVLTRHHTVVASAMATLQELSGGRVICGVGLGDSAVETIGLHPQRRADLEQTVATMRALWTGNTTDAEDDTAPLPWRGTGPSVPVYYAASGPRMLRDGGRVADGVIAYVGVSEERIVKARELIAEGAAAGGRDPADVDVVLWVPCSVAATTEEACANIKPHAARALLHGHPVELPNDERETVEVLRRHYDYQDHMRLDSGHSELVPDQVATRFGVAGTEEECVEQLRGITTAGVDTIGLIPMGHDRLEILRRYATEIIPLV